MSEDDTLLHKILPAKLVKGGYLMIKGNPCWITEITAKVKGTGPTANDRITVVGYNINTCTRTQDVFNLTAGDAKNGMLAPLVTTAQYALLDIDAESGFLSMLTDDGETKEDVCLSKAAGEDAVAANMPAGLGPRSEDEDAGWDDVGADIMARFDEGEALLITVQSVMGRDYPVRCVKDPDS